MEQYRTLKAQQEASATTPTPNATTQVQTQPTQTQTPAQTTTPNQTKPDEVTTQLPEKITIEGVGEVTLEELRNGYLRQSDYTKKTQEVSRKTKEVEEAVVLYEHLRQNPHLAQQLLQTNQLPTTLDPTQSKVMELENKLYDMMLEREIETLQGKYPDFEIREVLQMAQAKNIANLEDAYLLAKSHKTVAQPQNLEEVKKQLRQELLKEIEQERNATHTIISAGDGGAIVQDNTPRLSEAERKVASMMKMSDADYVKWRDAGRK